MLCISSAAAGQLANSVVRYFTQSLAIMLSRKDVKGNFLAFKICEGINFLPLEFEEESREISLEKSLWKRIWYFFWLADVSLHNIFMWFRLVQSLLIPERFVLHHAALHVICLGGSSLFTIWHFILCIDMPLDNLLIFNQLFLTSTLDSRESSLETAGKSKSNQERLLLVLPLLFVLASFLFGAINVLELNSAQFYTSILPPGYQSWGYVAAVVFHEWLIFLHWTAMAHFGIFILVSFFQSCQDFHDIYSQILKGTEEDGGELERLYINLRQLELRTVLFNKVYANCILGLKVIVIVISVVGISFFIRVHNQQPFIALVNLSLGIFAFAVYAIVFDKGFSIPNRIERLKTSALVINQRVGSAEMRRAFARRMKSMPKVAVRVGNFHILQRTSTPLIVDFVTKQICTLLITFP